MASVKSEKISIVLLLKRKPELTKEEFTEHCNAVHAKMAEGCFGHLYDSYTRNLIRTSGAHASTAPAGAESGDEAPYDAITVITFADRQALGEMQRLVQEPDQLQSFLDDEDKFLDRSSKVAFMCDQFVSPTPPG